MALLRNREVQIMQYVDEGSGPRVAVEAVKGNPNREIVDMKELKLTQKEYDDYVGEQNKKFEYLIQKEGEAEAQVAKETAIETEKQVTKDKNAADSKKAQDVLNQNVLNQNTLKQNKIMYNKDGSVNAIR